VGESPWEFLWKGVTSGAVPLPASNDGKRILKLSTLEIQILVAGRGEKRAFCTLNSSKEKEKKPRSLEDFPYGRIDLTSQEGKGTAAL